MRGPVDARLPTTMVGSYPRPTWFKDQQLGRDIRAAFEAVDHAEAFDGATGVAVRDQAEVVLDSGTDGQMYFDDYVGVKGSFCWYMYERIPGFEPAREERAYRPVLRQVELRLITVRANTMTGGASHIDALTSSTHLSSAARGGEARAWAASRGAWTRSLQNFFTVRVEMLRPDGVRVRRRVVA